MTHTDFYMGEEVINFQQKCPVVFLLDTSGSMAGPRIDELNRGLQIFLSDSQDDATLLARLDLAIIAFNDREHLDHDFTILQEYSQMPILTAGGTTNLEAGMKHAIDLLIARKEWYRSTNQTYYRPYIVLITDGQPDQNPGNTGLTARIKSEVNNKSFNFWAFGVDGANMQVLDSMACPGVGGSLPAMRLEGTKLTELFQWLSASFSKVSGSKDGQGIDMTPEKDKNPFMITV
ncbi:MAG: VWA domain-containing protein [Saprospiraceae bacterium]|nr:VWA domain-containing protein [Saprospiraceae bacterium]